MAFVFIILGGCDFFGTTLPTTITTPNADTTEVSSNLTTESQLSTTVSQTEATSSAVTTVPTTVTTVPTTVPVTTTTEIPSGTISFEENGGSTVADITSNPGVSVEEPEEPTMTGFSFEGWYEDADLTIEYAFTTMPEDSITVYAKWSISQYTISFEANGGTEVVSISQDYLSIVIEPENPSKTDYVFAGWYIDNDFITRYVFTTMPSEDIILYAKWEEDTSVVEPSDYTFAILEDGTYEITGYTGVLNDIEVPSVYSEIPVTSIANWAFQFTSVTSIIIPSSIMNISENAFCQMNELTSIVIQDGNTVYSSENGILFNYSKTILLWYPAGKTGDEYQISDGVLEIGNHAFLNSAFLINVMIPDSVTHIGSAAFSGCSKLSGIMISRYVVYLGQCIFQNQTSFKSIHVDSENEFYSSIDGVLFNKDKTVLIEYPTGKDDLTYIIPSSVTDIGAYSFSGVLLLTSVTIPNTVLRIGAAAFHGTSALTSVIFEPGCQLTTISSSAFSYATALTEIVLPDGILTIEDSAFGSTFALTSIFIPNTVTSIGYGAFWGANLLSSVIFEEGSQLTSIGSYAFRYCGPLSRINLPDSVLEISEFAFIDCPNLVIYTSQLNRPSGWDVNWNPDNLSVVWGYVS